MKLTVVYSDLNCIKGEITHIMLLSKFIYPRLVLRLCGVHVIHVLVNQSTLQVRQLLLVGQLQGFSCLPLVRF